LVARGVPVPEAYYTLETLIPMLSVYAPPLANEYLCALLRGEELWCQGFSEPDAGSDLASLRTKAERDGDGWVINGHKIWTSQVTVAQRCVALVRTGTPESRHRGLSMILVDHDTPGVTARPIRALTGRDEFGEVLFDDVHVGGDRLIGNEGDGWAVAMYLLQWERGMYPWQRQAALLTALDRLLAEHADRLDPGELADAYLAILPMRVSSRNTIRRLAAGENPGPEVSVDKVLLARAEVLVHDLADAVLLPAIELGDDHDAEGWRHDYLFSRAAPIYGGSIEIQRTILADRVLGLPRG
jgi:alkylation response protein AidB-like acyl-CoA dehydrogenase